RVRAKYTSAMHINKPNHARNSFVLIRPSPMYKDFGPTYFGATTPNQPSPCIDGSARTNVSLGHPSGRDCTSVVLLHTDVGVNPALYPLARVALCFFLRHGR